MDTIKGIQLQIPQRRQQPHARHKNGEQVYFQGSKKNQIAEMKVYFRSILNSTDNSFYHKELIKKIIAYTTQGVDTSRLYPQMVLASATKDIIEKKLIFFYLSTYSAKNADFARMAVNTFMKDTISSDPNIRSLAIRHLSNLRFKGREQYVMPVLRVGLSDLSAQVKKSCAMGMAKVLTESHRKQQNPERDEELLNTFYGMLRDSDPYVICTILEAINEIQPQGIAISKKLTHYLVENLSLFSQIQLPAILKYVDLYDPKNEQELYEILNTIVGRIKNPSLSVVTSVSKIFLKYAEEYPKLLPDLLDRIKSAILSFVNHDTPQIQWVALKHIVYLVDRYKTDLFVSEIKKFFISYQEPSYLKTVKIKLLQKNCRKSNLGDVLTQLCEYLLEEDISREAANALQMLMLKSESETESKLIAKSIIKTVQTSSCSQDFICNNVLPGLRNFLRKQPNELCLLQGVFYRLVYETTSDEARVAIIEIIGQYGDQIQDAIQLLAVSQESKVSDDVRISLLRANIKIFFKRPFQMVNLVTNLFRDILSDDMLHIQVRDYVAYLYRALESDPEEFRKHFVENNRNLSIYKQSEPQTLQFNSFQIIYEKPEVKWIIGQNKGYEIQQIQSVDGLQIDLEQTGNNEESIPLPKEIHIDLNSKYRNLQSDDFYMQFEMTSEEYEVCWQDYEIGSSITRILINMPQLSQETLEQLFKLWGISAIASAEDESSIKLYLYCKLNQGEISCMEFHVLKQAQTMTLLIKSENEELGGFVSKYIENFLILNEIL